MLFLIEAHQVENVEVGDHELEHVQPVGRDVLSGRGVRNDVVQENGVRVDGVRGGCVLLTEIDVRDHRCPARPSQGCPTRWGSVTVSSSTGLSWPACTGPSDLRSW